MSNLSCVIWLIPLFLFQGTGCKEKETRITSVNFGEQEFADFVEPDEEYLKESIIDPGAKVVKGREGEMPSFLGVLSDNDINSIILYFKTL